MGKDPTYVLYAERRSERKSERIPGKTGSIIATFVCSLLGPGAKG
jgi:hypothetical protein